MTTTATQASDSAAQATAAAAAYEAAFAATVPPPVIAANRALLAVLVATNFLGINTAAIMATEAHYMEMWAQDVTAMVTYQASAQAASTLTPFSPAPPTTTGVTPTGLTQDAGTALGSLQNFLPQSFSDLTNGIIAFGTIGGLAFSPVGAVLDEGLWGSNPNNWPPQDITNTPPPGGDVPNVAVPGVIPGSVPTANTVTVPGGGVTASLGQSKSVGNLSVPKSWATEEITPAATPLTAEETPYPAMVPPMFAGISNSSKIGLKYGKPVKVVPQHPWGG